MASASGPQWLITEDASRSVLVALYLRQALALRSPDELPLLRDLTLAPPSRSDEEQALLERQWREYWAMTVEPQAHPSPSPLELVDGFETYVALPVDGCGELRTAIGPHAEASLAYSATAHSAYRARRSGTGSAYRAYASVIAEHERQVGRRAHSFELNVQILPLAQRGLWWIGSLTIAVTDTLRSDVVAFDHAIHPIIAELA